MTNDAGVGCIRHDFLYMRVLTFAADSSSWVIDPDDEVGYRSRSPAFDTISVVVSERTNAREPLSVRRLHKCNVFFCRIVTCFRGYSVGSVRLGPPPVSLSCHIHVIMVLGMCFCT